MSVINVLFCTYFLKTLTKLRGFRFQHLHIGSESKLVEMSERNRHIIGIGGHGNAMGNKTVIPGVSEIYSYSSLRDLFL